jgi:hypothetical protein
VTALLSLEEGPLSMSELLLELSVKRFGMYRSDLGKL